MLELLCTEVQEYLIHVEITQAKNGTDARNHAMSQAFDLIISDNVMPGILGSSVLRELRLGQGPNRDTPFIFCSGNFSLDEIKGIKDCHLLQKPFDISKLHALLARLFQFENPRLA